MVDKKIEIGKHKPLGIGVFFPLTARNFFFKEKSEEPVKKEIIYGVT
jgi:hypothetical protein